MFGFKIKDKDLSYFVCRMRTTKANQVKRQYQHYLQCVLWIVMEALKLKLSRMMESLSEFQVYISAIYFRTGQTVGIRETLGSLDLSLSYSYYDKATFYI